MAHRIVSVDPGSPAEKAGVRVDDRLVGIDGKTVVDFLDYQEFSAERRLTLNLRRGEQKIDLKVKKGEYESLGLNFQLPMMSPVRMCLNHCLFCFVDQLPAHVRDTMRVKDDDWRMSLMMGNYVTLTNITERELDRIIARHASPLYVSVHAMDPDLREKLLQTPRARMLADQLQKLSDNGIEFHCQAVLCPGLNDGDALEDTIRRLTALPGALSLALVPVGLTDHREGLYPLRKIQSGRSAARDRTGERLARTAADGERDAVRVPVGRILFAGGHGSACGRRIRGLRADRRRRRSFAKDRNGICRGVGRAADGDEDARAGEEDRDCVRRFRGRFSEKAYGRASDCGRGDRSDSGGKSLFRAFSHGVGAGDGRRSDSSAGGRGMRVRSDYGMYASKRGR